MVEVVGILGRQKVVVRLGLHLLAVVFISERSNSI
jgi:hypothetical protein